jgi:hypothetical protein
MSDTLCEKVFTYNQTLKCVFSQITSFTILKSPPLPLSSTLRSAALHELPHALYYASGLPERQATRISPIGRWIVVQSIDRYVGLLVHIPIRGKGPPGYFILRVVHDITVLSALVSYLSFRYCSLLPLLAHSLVWCFAANYGASCHPSPEIIPSAPSDPLSPPAPCCIAFLYWHKQIKYVPITLNTMVSKVRNQGNT